MTQTIAQELIAQGLQEGRAEGLREGELRTQRANIKQVLRIRFGSIAAELEQRLEQIQQVEVLQQIFEQALKIQSLDELQL
jgi:flagellar biosynthesis/type III secretory pathway protein FliH